MDKIALLFIDQPYAIYHALGIGVELAKLGGYQVDILCTPRNRKIIDRLLGVDANTANLNVISIRPYWHFTLPHYLEIKLQFRSVLFFRYRRLLASYQAIINTLYHDSSLKSWLPVSKQPALVFANHGISNRKYSFDSAIKKFDFILIAGNQELQTRQELGQLEKDGHALVGYPKYDLVRQLSYSKPFSNDKPIVLYNPHWLLELSSYYAFGKSILEFFAANSAYNLIVAPHAALAMRNKKIGLELSRYQKFPNIHIDLGSEAAYDMSYLKMADLYLGDVSSQALEFLLLKKRPCLFLDAHHLQDNPEEFFISWQFGKVVDDVSDFFKLLEEAFDTHVSNYLSKQEQGIADLFYQSEEPASLLAAKAISRFLSYKQA